MDHSTPVLAGDDDAARNVRNSTLPLSRLVAGKTAADEIELAFSRRGCGAVLVRLDASSSGLYDMFYRLQWQLGTRAFDSTTEAEEAAARFAALDLRVRLLLCQCAIGVARARLGLAGATSSSLEKLAKLAPAPFAAAVGRPLLADRQEFHPSVDWLMEQAQAGRLQREEHPEVAVVGDRTHHGGRTPIVGRVRADEAQLLALYHEWQSASADERRGHGNKYNGNVYYGAFRGRTHVDGGSTMTVLFGPGEVRDSRGRPADGGTNRRQFGGTLIVKTPLQERFTALPYRLPCGSPYVVVFFNETNGVFENGAGTGVGVREHAQAAGINSKTHGWPATVHGVSRIEDTRFSRGQAVMLLRLTDADLA